MSLLLAIVFCGYFVLAGLDYGVALVASGRSDLHRIAPFFLGNEVWLVAGLGLIFGAFPHDEGLLLGPYRLPVAVALTGVVLVTASFGLRLFSRSASGAAGTPEIGPLDGVARIGGALAALGWGAVLGAIWQGGLFRATFTIAACALGMLGVVGVHGWAFLRRRWAVLAATTAVLVGSVGIVGTSITWHPASSAALDLVTPVAYALVPLLIVIQGASWWMFRTRHHSEPSAVSSASSA
jgi:cytochrome bd ubiquinol oxidase subunit II